MVQERPCTRCVKRDIGHLCHDEPRESVRVVKGKQEPAIVEAESAVKEEVKSSVNIIPYKDTRPGGQHRLQAEETELSAAVPPANDEKDLSKTADPRSGAGSKRKGPGHRPQPCELNSRCLCWRLVH